MNHFFTLRARLRKPLSACLWSLPILLFSAAGCHHAGTQKAAPPVAPVAVATRIPLENTLSIAGEFTPYQEVELHAKVSGYIRHISVDIGDRVRQGQVLATLEVPELQDQLEGTRAQVRHSQSEIGRAQSELINAQSAHDAVHAAYKRLEQASKEKPGLIAEQELDDARAKDQGSEAQIDVAKAALDATRQQLGVSTADSHRVQTLSNYSSIVAPFNGVVTMRYADTGSLIQSGTASNTQSMPVVRVAQSDMLRLRMPVPESDVAYIQVGGEVHVKVQSTDRSFTARIIRFSRALDANTRTMLAEVDVPNPGLTLSPGMYAETTIQLQHKPDALTVPAQAVLHTGDQAGERGYVLVVNSSNHVERRDVSLGIQTANRTEITSGLNDGERVIASGQGSYQPGELVTPHDAFIPNAKQEVSE